MKIRHFILFIFCVCTNLTSQFATLDILQGRKSIEIPFEYVQGFIIIEVRLNNLLPLDFLFDTGAENSVLLSTEYADLLGLVSTDTINIIGADREEVKLGKIMRRVPLKLEKGGVFVSDIIALEEHSLDFENLVGREIDGIIGGNTLIGAVVEINYKKNKIIFHDPNEFKVPRKFNLDSIEIIKQRPFINTSISIAGEKTVNNLKFLFDSGASIHILVDEASHPALSMPDSILEGRIGYGLGGQVGGYLGNAHHISMLDDSFDNLKVYFQEEVDDILSQYLHNHRHGILGNVYWERKRVIIDYPRELLYSKNVSKKKKAFRFNKSGMIVFAVGKDFNQFLINHIIPDSPAAKAGLQSGDIIVSFNGFPASLLSLDYINKRLSSKKNKKIKIKVRRSDKKISTSFLLEDLLLIKSSY